VEEINVSDLFCYGKKIVVGFGKNRLSNFPFDFEIPRGKLTALIGPNGAGKTSLLKAMLGEQKLVEGEIHLAGTQSYVPQENRFPPGIRLKDFLRLAFLKDAGLFGQLPVGDHPSIVEKIEQFGLSALKDRTLETLSTGERQRAFLARAVLQGADVLLLDEPTNHLDPGGTNRFWADLLTARRQKPFEILVSTHDLSFVKKYCDWVCAVKNGAVIFSGPSAECFAAKLPAELFGLTDLLW
jgi:ABC-type Mn2+/Zn2+ transport system ATPase subunit